MVEGDVVGIGEGEFVIGPEELLGVGIEAGGADPGEITKEGEAVRVGGGVGGGEFGTVDGAGAVVEGGEDDGSAELAEVDEVAGVFVEAVEAEVPLFGELVGDADVVVVGAFDAWRAVEEIFGGVGGVLEFIEGCERHVLDGRWDEVAGVTGMEGGGIIECVDEVEARADLAVVVEIGVEAVVAKAVVEGEFGGDGPLILEIEAGFEGVVGGIVFNGSRSGADVALAIDIEDRGVGDEFFAGVVGDESEAEGMAVIEEIGGVELGAVSEESVENGAGDAEECEVVDGIGAEVDVGIAGEEGKLEGEPLEGFLVGDDGVIFLLVLVLVDF